jgi:hypothetical protein
MCQAHIRFGKMAIITITYLARLNWMRLDMAGGVHGDGTGKPNFLHTSDVIRADVQDLYRGAVPCWEWIQRVENQRFNDCRDMIDSATLRPPMGAEHGLRWAVEGDG